MTLSLSIIVTITIFVIGNLVATVWWASRLSNMVENLNVIVSKLSVVLEDHTKNLYTKSEAYQDMKKIEEKFDAVWRRVDENRSNVLEMKTKCSLLFEKHTGINPI